MSKVNIFLADGFEEVEGIAVIDLLRRARIDIDVVSIMETRDVTSSHNIVVKADKMINEVNFEEADMIILPGGLKGTNKLGECKLLIENIKKYNEQGKMLAAICAAPSVLGDNGVLKGKDATCYPGFEDRLTGANTRTDKVVCSKNCITSRGMGTAIDFGLEIIKHYQDEASAKKIADMIIYQ